MSRSAGIFRFVLLMLMTLPTPLAAQSLEPIRYTLTFPAPHTHYVEVSAVIPTGGRPDVEVMMAVWTPGSYLVREYARHVEDVRAAAPDGRVLAVEKSRKNRWRIGTGGAQTITLRYRVYSREMGVRSNWVEAAFAMLNGAPTFITLVEKGPRPHEVVLEPANGWSRSLTGLAEMPGGAPHRFRAPDFDTLVDSPIIVGNPDVHEFTVAGKRHYLVNTPPAPTFDGARAAKDLQTLVQEHHRMWGTVPYDKYLFLNMITEAGGGLEHKNSTLLMTSRWTTRTRRAYLSWLELASHEYFHAWNVKRLRPVELGPFDYENEVHTRSLWISEGFTDYYGELAVHRAGLSTRAEYLEGLSNLIEGVQETPGRLVQSVAGASYDAWIKHYRPDENSPNVAISYYTKGAVIAFLLDARIRNLSGGARGLDDVMRAAFERYSGERGFTADQFKAVAESVAGAELDAFWDAATESTAELDYREALETFGLRFRPAPEPTAERPAKAWIGAATRNDAGRLVVTQVRRGTPAHQAGLNVDDEILAIDDYRVRADRLDNRLEQYRPGDRVSVLAARREQIVRIDLTLGVEPGKPWRLEISAAPTDSQKKQLAGWLQPSGQQAAGQR